MLLGVGDFRVVKGEVAHLLLKVVKVFWG